MADLRDPNTALQQLTHQFTGRRVPAAQMSGTQTGYVLDNDVTNPAVNPPGTCRVIVPGYSTSNALGPISYPGTLVPPGGGLPGPTTLGGTQVSVSFVPPMVNSPSAIIGQIANFIAWPQTAGTQTPPAAESTAGQLFYNQTTNQLQYFNGTVWGNILRVIAAPSTGLPTGADVGQTVYETDTQVEVVWDGAEWRLITTPSFSSNPASGVPGQLIFNTTTNSLFYWNGTVWAGTGVAIAATAANLPVSPIEGQLAYEEDIALLLVYTGTSWVPVNVVSGTTAAISAQFPTPQQGQLAYDTSKITEVAWDGTEWRMLSPTSSLVAARPAGPQAGNLNFDSDTGQESVYNGSGWVPAGPAGQSSARAYRNSAFLPSSSGWQLVPLDTESWDIGSNFNTGTSLYTCRTSGIYSVKGQVNLAIGAASALLQVGISKNAANPPTVQGGGMQVLTAHVGDLYAFSAADDIQCSAGDTLALWVYNTAGGTGMNTSSSGNFLSVIQVG